MSEYAEIGLAQLIYLNSILGFYKNILIRTIYNKMK